MINYDDFFSLIDIEECEKASAKEYIKLRGFQEHVDMAKYLLSFSEGRKPTYKEIATSFRYDKRIRRILYKYLGLLEEYYRAYICNTFIKPEKIGISTKKSLFDYLSVSGFTNLIKIVWSLKPEHKAILFENKNVLYKNLDALVELRNAISHNRTIINYMNFKEVTLNDREKGYSLSLNIKNLLSLLPLDVSESCRKELNDASKQGKKCLAKQVAWKPVKSIILHF